MAKVKVWNDNTVDFKQEHNGDPIAVKAGQFIEMDAEEANVFVSAWYPPQYDGMGVQTVESKKKLRIERNPHDVAAANPEKIKCAACGIECTSWTELDAHTKLRHANLQHAIDPGGEADAAERKRASGAKG